MDQTDMRIADLAKRLDAGFAQVAVEAKEWRAEINARFDQVDKRFEQVDKRFEQIDKRFEQVDKRFEQVDKRFEQIDGDMKDLRKEVVGLHRLIIQIMLALLIGFVGADATGLIGG